MYLENKADLVCEVKSSGPVEMVKWFNKSGGEVLLKKNHESPPPNTYIATAEITYDEWTNGMTWYCEAKDSMQKPTKKYFEKINGEYSHQTMQQNCHMT